MIQFRMFPGISNEDKAVFRAKAIIRDAETNVISAFSILEGFAAAGFRSSSSNFPVSFFGSG